MKKVLLTVLLLLVAIAVFVACTGPAETTADSTTDTTAGVDTTGDDTTDTTEGDTDDTTAEGTPSVTTPPESQPIDPDSDVVKTDNYTAVLNDAEWVPDKIDASSFQFAGTGADVLTKINLKYNNGKSRTYHNADGEEYSTTQIRKLPSIGATVTENADGTLDILIVEVNLRVNLSWKSVTSKAGSYLMFEFTTNLAGTFATTVTKTEGGSQRNAFYTQGGIEVKGKDGTYTGIAKCTTPYAIGSTYYINLCVDNSASGYPVLASIPVSVVEAKYKSDYSLLFQGDWELIKDPEYLPNLVDLFYNVYPRLYARFSLDEFDKKAEPKVITFMADKNYDGVAYCAGTTVCVSVDYANGHPSDLGFFSHEITHSVQQYGALKNYGGTNSWTDPETEKTIVCKSWWTENMANYGGFRYFHWGYSTKFVQIYNVQTQSSLWNWNWEPYGDGSKLFLSYLDQTFPSIDENKNGKLEVEEFGVIDRVNYAIKMATSQFSDHPYDPNSPFNQAVKAGTDGKFNTMEEVRQQYEKDCKSGAWVFKGFGNCVDNWVTEDLDGIPNPEYPMLEPVAKGDKTNPILGEAVLEGTSVLGDASFVEYSGQLSRYPIKYILDGKLNNRWQSDKDSIGDYKYQLQGFKHGFVIDLGSEKTFDTYTLVTAGYEQANDTHNIKEWEILVSNDGRTWTSVDYQKDNKADVVSVNIGSQTARYVEVRFFTSAQQSASDTIRLNEFMLFE